MCAIERPRDLSLAEGIFMVMKPSGCPASTNTRTLSARAPEIELSNHRRYSSRTRSGEKVMSLLNRLILNSLLLKQSAEIFASCSRSLSRASLMAGDDTCGEHFSRSEEHT